MTEFGGCGDCHGVSTEIPDQDHVARLLGCPVVALGALRAALAQQVIDNQAAGSDSCKWVRIHHSSDADRFLFCRAGDTVSLRQFDKPSL